MAKRPKTAPMVRCPDVAHILNKFAEPIFWCKPENRFRKNSRRENLTPDQYQQCDLGFDPYTDYVWMPYINPSGVLLHLAYVDCDYVGDDIGCAPGPDFAIELAVEAPMYITTLKVGFSPSSWDTFTPWSDTYWTPVSAPYSNIIWPTLTGSTYDTKIVNGNNTDLVPHTFYVSTSYSDYMIIEWDNSGWANDGSLFTLKDSGGTDVNINMVTLSPATVVSTVGSVNVSDPTKPVLILGDISSRFYLWESGMLQYASISNLKSISFTHNGSIDSTSTLIGSLTAAGWVYTWAASGLTNTITNPDQTIFLSSSLFPVSLLSVVFVAPGASSGSITITSSLNTTGIETYKSLNYIANIGGDCAGSGSGFAWQDPDGVCWLAGTGSIDIVVTGNIPYLEMAITPLVESCTTNCSDLPGYTYVPDDNFEQALIDLGYDTGPLDNCVLTANISGVTSLNVASESIADLTGIEDFTSLTTLFCQNNQLTSLDVSNNTALAILHCANNLLTSLDVSNNTLLTNFYCYLNQLTSLDVSNNTALIEFWCGDNLITSINVSSHPNITQLLCNDNQLTSLDLKFNSALTWLNCGDNQLTCLNVKNGNNTSVSTFEATSNNLTCITVDDPAYSTANWTSIDPGVVFSSNCNDPCTAGYTYVPDDNFEQALIDLGYDTPPLDNYVLTANISGVTSLNVGNDSIADLTGIEDFVSLTYLYCGINSLSSLDVSNITPLSILWCHSNNLTSLSLTGNTALTFVNCSNNSLTYLNLKNGNNTSMSIDTTSNSLTCITVDDPVWATANWTAPGEIDSGTTFSTKCGYTYVPDNNFELALISLGYDTFPLDDYVLTANISGVTTLDVSFKSIVDLTGIEDFASLTELECQGNQLTGLTLSQNTALDSLHCQNNLLTSLDVSGATVLDYLSCSGNQLASLDVSQNAALTFYGCGGNLLTSLNMSGNTVLTTLWCDNNPLTSIELSLNTVLDDLSCYDCFTLTSLDVSNNTALTTLLCGGNLLTSLDVSINTNLEGLSCYSNNLTSLYVSGSTALTQLHCQYNQLSSIDVSNNTALTYLRCDDNQLTSLDVSNNTVLSSLECVDNQLTSLNLTGNTVLERLHCDDNLLTCLNIQNGNNTAMTAGRFDARTNSLTCITVDNVAYSDARVLAGDWEVDPGVVFSATTCPGC